MAAPGKSHTQGLAEGGWGWLGHRGGAARAQSSTSRASLRAEWAGSPFWAREHEKKSVGAVPGSQAGDGQGMFLRASRTRTGPSDNPVGDREKVDSRGNGCQGFCPRG